MTIARISRAMNVPRSTIYYRKKETTGTRKSRVPEDVEKEIVRLSEERTTYGYRMIRKFLARTTSKRHNIRLLYFYLAILLYNMFVAVNDSMTICSLCSTVNFSGICITYSIGGVQEICETP